MKVHKLAREWKICFGAFIIVEILKMLLSVFHSQIINRITNKLKDFLVKIGIVGFLSFIMVPFYTLSHDVR